MRGCIVSLFVRKLVAHEYIEAGFGSGAGFYEGDFTPGRESVQLEFFMIFWGGCIWGSNGGCCVQRMGAGGVTSQPLRYTQDDDVLGGEDLAERWGR
jgi:hypothetical protein